MRISPILASVNSKKNLKAKSFQSKNLKNTNPQKNSISAFYYTVLSFKRLNEAMPRELASKIPNGVDIRDLLENAKTRKNIIGSGANSVVYNIPQLDDYVLKVLNSEDANTIFENEFPEDVNVGQPIWQDPENPRHLVLKKVEGKEHSIPNWNTTIWDPARFSPLPVTKEQATLFCKQVDELAKFPQTAFDELAQKAKMLDEKGYKIDSINPNNLIVDKEKEKIHIIDFFKVASHERDVYRNSYMDLVAVALDFTLFPEYFDKMDCSEQRKTMENVETIESKVLEASKKCGFSCDKNRFKTFIRTTSRWFTAHSVPNEKTKGVYYRYYDVRLDDFINMVDDPFNWEWEREKQFKKTFI